MSKHSGISADGGNDVACNLCGSSERRHLFTKKGYRLVSCNECGLAYIANPPDEEAIKAIYTASANYHEGLLDPRSEEYRRQRRTAHQHLRMLKHFRPKLAGLKILDVGCSSGLFLAEARTHGMDCYGTEISPETSAFARKHYDLEIHQGDWRSAGYADGFFDVISLFDVIEHLRDPQRELKDLERLLKPGGLLLQSTPDIDGLFPRASYPFANKLDYWPHPEPPHHLFQFSEKTLTAIVENAGFTVEGAKHTAIDLSYNFGTPKSWKRSPKMIVYAALFAPIALLGKVIGQGDWLYLGATRR